MEGRHVGLDFYDLLIEVLYRTRPAGLPKLRATPYGASDTTLAFLDARRSPEGLPDYFRIAVRSRTSPENPSQMESDVLGNTTHSRLYFRSAAELGA
jgi:hypothetical protein